MPTADLEDDRPALPDEVALGASYQQIDHYLEGLDVEPDVAATIESLYRATGHKRALPVTPLDHWWRPSNTTTSGDRATVTRAWP